MSIFRRKKQTDAETESLKSFLDMIAPSIVKFETGYYICGNTFRCIWALREYPTSTDDLAILRHLGEKHGVTLHIYTRMVSPLEERKIVHNAEIRNRMNRGSSQDLQRSVEAESNLQDVANLIGSLHRNKEPLLHCAVYIEMIAGDMQELQILQTNVEVELMRSKLNVDRLKLRQQAGFCAVSPVGYNAFGTEYERVLPASSVANLFPFNYSGKTDRKGFYIGKDKYGSNIVVDFDQRDEDKTSANVLILGNSGQGKSYLMKLLLLNFLEAGNLLSRWMWSMSSGSCARRSVGALRTSSRERIRSICWNPAAGTPMQTHMMWMRRKPSGSPPDWRNTHPSSRMFFVPIRTLRQRRSIRLKLC